jgi:hypothetical protein
MKGWKTGKQTRHTKFRTVNLYDVTRLKYLWHNVAP